MVSLVAWSAVPSIFFMGAEWRRAARLAAIFSERVVGTAMALAAIRRPVIICSFIFRRGGGAGVQRKTSKYAIEKCGNDVIDDW